MIQMGIISSLFGQSTENIEPICNVDLERYLGRWYEIARLPHSFEKGLEKVTATYRSQNDGKIEVVNAGVKNGEKQTARGIAWVPDMSCTGRLYVSFFRPFKSEYKIIRLDQSDYKYAVVTSSSKKYLWFLSREPHMSDALYDELIEFAASLGFDISQIIKVSHD